MLTDHTTLTIVSPISTSMLVPSTNMPELESDDNDDDEEEEEEETDPALWRCTERV